MELPALGPLPAMKVLLEAESTKHLTLTEIPVGDGRVFCSRK